jgi:pyruvate dehydrogenase E1 component alpha subunit
VLPSVATNTEFLIELYRRMLMVRRVEERLAALFADGEIPAFIHLGIGPEAVAIGVTAALE